jgi:GTPase SAR1 family protein
LVGNKGDLENKRQVKREEGQWFVDNLGIPFIETSAKTAYNITSFFSQMASRISKRQGSTNKDKPYIRTKPTAKGKPVSWGCSYQTLIPYHLFESFFSQKIFFVLRYIFSNYF